LVKPRPASTIAFLRHTDDRSLEIYMTQRPLHFSFLGGYFVFPGGAVDAEDKTVPTKIDCHWDSFDPAIQKVYWIAAVREAFEETGVLLARNSNGKWTWNMSFEEDRAALLQNELTFSKLLEKHNLSLDFSIFQYIGRRVTPESSPKRFDTRFFLVTVPKTVQCRPYSREVIAAKWMQPEYALKQWEKGSISLARPTVKVLQTLKGKQALDGLSLISIGEQKNLSF
jgi:8-oxo-dGTP pyrophosphatase MutT (NUDIX family)